MGASFVLSWYLDVKVSEIQVRHISLDAIVRMSFGLVPTHKLDPGDVVVSRARDVTDPPHEAELGTGVRQPHDPVVHAHLAKKEIDLRRIREI